MRKYKVIAFAVLFSCIFDVCNTSVYAATPTKIFTAGTTAGIITELYSIFDSDYSSELESEKETYLKQANEYIAKLDGQEKFINKEILNIRESNLSNESKVIKIGTLLAEENCITHKTCENLFNWDNTLFDSDFETPGCYYKDGMSFDCSGFLQYLVWISTGTSTKEGILIGRGTYFSSIDGVSVDTPTRGTFCFHYNGGSGVKRIGEELQKNETPTRESNHVAIYLGNNKYLDCSESYGGVRIIDTTDNPFYEDFYTWYRDVLSDDTYVSTYEMNMH